MSLNAGHGYIDGRWVVPTGGVLTTIDPSTGDPHGAVATAGEVDVDLAVDAARRAFEGGVLGGVRQRSDLLRAIADGIAARADDLAEVVRLEMGSPDRVCREYQVPSGLAHFAAAANLVPGFAWQEQVGSTTVLREPIGVVAAITPWNWPLNQAAAKLAAAIAAGCTTVWKPSELSPFSAAMLMEIIHESGSPPGVVNLVHGGPAVGRQLAAHDDVDMVSITGSTAAGIDVAERAAATVKRVTQELGGKSANIILPGTDLERIVPRDVRSMMLNSGQSCDACTRLLVHRDELGRVLELAVEAVDSLVVGPPDRADTDLGPLVSERQFDRVQHFIRAGIDGGATVVVGGPGRPDHLERGWYARPTVFADVTPEMVIAREEIFGPVLSVLAYDDVDQAVAIANDSVYGLSGRVSAPNDARAMAVAQRLRTGMVALNGSWDDYLSPFGGYKRSGNGREFGAWGIAEYLEVKAVFRAAAYS